jgi:hypothetical protein
MPTFQLTNYAYNEDKKEALAANQREFGQKIKEVSVVNFVI